MKVQTGVANLLNGVIASADELANLGCRIFDQLPLEEQPRYLADLGCGNGFLLRAMFEAIRSRSRRGRALENYPLRLIGIDTDETALQAAGQHWADLPHVLIRAGSEDPQYLLSELSRQGILDPEQILYLLTFPNLTQAMGKLKRIVWKHGFILLDIHSSGAQTVPDSGQRNASKLFDTLGEQFSEASVLLMSAAGVGFFPERAAVRRWSALGSAQVALNRFVPRPYTVRHPTVEDTGQLRDLELAAWPESLCASDLELRRRIELIPKGQAVLESGGRLVAALYSQRIQSVDQLLHVNYATLPLLHDPTGRVAQLLGICVHPELRGRGFADELMDFMLVYFAACENIENLVGVTRCHHYWRQREFGTSHEDYVRSRNEHGRLSEPMLQFHEAHGALIRAVLPLFRPEDVQNTGAGVLIEYPLRGGSPPVEKGPRHRVSVREDISVVVHESIQQVLGSARTHLYELEAPLMEMGLSSLQLLELRYLLQERTAKELEPTCFFKWGTPAAIIGHLSGDVEFKRGSKSTSPSEDRETIATGDKPGGATGLSSQGEPIAIVGLGCHFPGDARGPNAFWKLLQEGQDAITGRPLSREEIIYPAESRATDVTFAGRGGFLNHIDQFDAGFFRISPREADLMDPQHRALLEVVWESLENSGCAPFSLRGSSTGVFVGMMARDYEAQIGSRGSVEDLSAYFSTGNAPSVAAGRLAYFFDWHGPALTVDTACSSSLVAVHLACQSLHSVECNLAVAAGVNLLMDGKSYLAFGQAGMLAPDGSCKAFDAAADGYVRSEGCGVVVLKRLSDARRDGDQILAVIRGSAVNQDGTSSGLTVPNQVSQQEVIERAVHRAQVAPREIVYLEAHGSGTSLGDPIEVQAAAAVLGQGRGADRPLLIGSVKTNIGHLEAAAGIAGLIKVILAMKHGVIPKHLHFQKPNPHIAWERLPVKVTSEATAWPGGRKIAGVSSFGFSGTNAHVIVEEAPAEQRIEPRENERSEHLLVLSARSEVALKQLAGRYVQWLEANPEAELADVCYSAGVGRSHLGQRAAAVVNSVEEAKELLVKLERGESGKGLHRGQSSKRPKVAWLFTGQGSQYVGMGRELYRNQPVVREVLDRCQELLSQEGERALLEILFEQEGMLNQTRYTQPALFALEVALAELWRSWGQEPDLVLGHSVGQYAAAVVAGILSLEEGLRLVAKRGELMGQLPAGGAMAAVFSDLAGLEEVLRQEADLSLAADNGGHLVLSGAVEVLERVLSDLRKAGVRSQRLNTSHGFHSKLMEPVLEEFESYARGVEFGTAKVGVVCNLTGNLLGAAEAAEPSYWRRHLRETVQFSWSIRTVAELGVELMLEVGPQPILLEIAQNCWPQSRPMALKVASMRRGQGETGQIAEAVAQLYVHGLAPDFAGWDRPWPRRKVSLPTYPFQRSRFWINANRHSGKEEGASSTSTLRTSTIQELLYEISWKSSGKLEPVSNWVPGCWLLLADRQGWATRIKAFLENSKQKCRLFYYDEFSSPNKLEEVLHHLERGDLPLRQVVHLWSLDLPTETQTAGVIEMQRSALINTLQVVKVLAQRPRSVQLRLITRGACAVKAGDLVEPFQAPWWGFGKVIGLELPNLRGALVDLPAAAKPDPDLVKALSRELVNDQEEHYVALRPGGRSVPRLIRAGEQSVATPLQLSQDASYLITGGLGALGLKTAGWLVERGAKNLVLVGRRTPNASALSTIERLRAKFGCQVEVWQDDISRVEGVKRVVNRISEVLPPLRGVVHAAGTIGKIPLTELSPDHLAEILAPKVQGAWWLHEHTRSINLDFFVAFSSVSSVWGGYGQAHYAAGNAFMDALMWSRRAQGLPATSLNFGPWDDGGMAEGELLRWLDATGVKPLNPLEALNGWQAAHGRVQTVIANIDWSRFVSIYQARRRRPLFDCLVPEVGRTDQAQEEASHGGHGGDLGKRMGESGVLGGTARANRSPVVRELEIAPAAQRRSTLDGLVRRAVGQVLRMSPAEIDPQLGFFDLGMDSMTAVEFRELLEQTLGCSLPATLAMDRPRVSEVVEYLLTEVLGFDSAKKAELATVHVSSPADESIAVIGLGCRVPGAEGPEQFWHLLQTESDAIGEIPSRRWDIGAYYDPDPEVPGKIYTRYAGLLDQIDQFDASLFAIAPREVASMDPQQRIILEVAWEALERAGVAPQVLGQTRTGVYLGASAAEYANLITAAGPEAIDAHFGTGTALNAIAGRLAFSLGLEGPALLIDTACSSSLVALHQACQALRSGECDLTLAGGVNLLLGPEGMMAFCRARMLAPDGRCKTFDAAADGYVRSEGCGVVVLKRLSDARRDGDRILAVVRGSAVNQDGASSGLTVPKGPAQERVIRQALRQAGIKPQEVVYLEAHGTGTSLGDPIEVQAAAAVLGRGRGADHPLLIGSVKTNIGHLEAAAGIAGLIKVILAMKHGVIPKHLHFQKPNPHIAWERLPVKVTSEATAWPGGRKIAGVSSFGFSGTNAHVIVEEAPAEQRIEPRENERSEHLLVLSARSEVALKQLAGRYVQWLEANPEAELADVCYSAGVGRSHLGQRAAAVVNSVEEAKELLVKLERGESGKGLHRGQSSKRPKVAWLFTGQGSQYVGMGRELYRNQPVVREVLDRCQELLSQEGERALLEILFEQEGMLNQTRYTQPALFALEVALAELWRSWGQEPDLVLGHSVGQYAAAVVAGILSLEEGLRLVAKRGELMGQLPAGGAMAAVFSDLAGLEEVLRQEADLSLAADNGGHLVLSGAVEVLERVLSDLRKAGVRSQRLNTSHGFHSKLMEPVLEEFESYARGVEFGTAKVGVVCNLTGNLLGAAEAAEPSYWRRHLRETVQFSRSIRTVAELGVELMLEVGPQPILLEIAQNCWPQPRPMALKVASMRRGQGETGQIAEAVAQLYVHGLTPDFAGWDRPWPRRKVSLPTYPFQRSRFWIKPRSESPSSAHGTSPQLLGTRNELASGEIVHRSELGCVKHPWLIDHQLYQTVVVPGPAYVAMIFSAAGGPAEIRDIAFREPLLLPESIEQDFQLLFSAPNELDERSFQFHSRSRINHSAPWTQHASGVMRPLKSSAKPGRSSTPNVEQLQKRMKAWSVEKLYAYFSHRELQLGPSFRSIRAIWRGSTEAVGEVVFAEPLIPFLRQEPIHPAVMDSCMHVVGAVPYDGSDSAEDIFYAPLHIGSVTLYQSVPSRFFCYATASEGIAAGAETRVYDLDLITPAGELIGRIDGFTMKRASRKAFLRAVLSTRDQLLYHVEWRNHPVAEVSKQPANDRWLLVTREHAIGSQLAEKIRQRGQRCVLAIPGGVYRQLSDGSYEIPFEDAPEWGRFLSGQETSNGPLSGIIYLCSSETPLIEPISAGAIETELHFDCGTLLAIVQTLIRHNRILNRGLLIVTNGAQATETANPQSVIQSSLWGMGRVVQSEHPDLSCRLIDLDQPVAKGSLEQLIDELFRETAETQVLLQKSRTLVPRLVRVALEQRKAVSFRQDATYLLTGGFGGIGLELARWLVQRGVRNLALNGRNAPKPEALAVIAELRALGARVELFQADVSKEEEVNDCLTSIHRLLPPLRGVFHLAGVARDGALAGQTWPQFAEVIAPKVQGAWNLHRLTLDQPLDWFVLFSSVAVLLGSPGQVNYAAANAYLDALAHYRKRVLGLSALSINWGPWSEVGLAARRADELSQRFHRTGLEWLNPRHALEALENAMTRSDHGFGVMAIDWATFADQGGRKNVSPLFSELVDLPAKNKTVQPTSRRLNPVQDARSEERRSVLINLVAQEVQQVLQTELPPKPEDDFSTLGMDSLMAIELRNRLQRQIEGETPLPYALAFQHSNVKTVAEFLYEKLEVDQERIPETVESTSLPDVHADQSPAPQIGRLSGAQPVGGTALAADRVSPSRAGRSLAFEPVAIIGISGRFPGAPDLQSYWQNLAEGRSSIAKFPRERSAMEKSQSEDSELLGEKNFDEPWGGFLDAFDEFDAPFFKMARAEAEQLDPQHRLFLQEAWKALEDSGYSARELKGRCCGIFVGAGTSDYYAQITEPDAHSLTGNIGSGLTGRLAYLLDWSGPCLALDTACASSFSAIHLACASLARGECDLALTGGVHVATGTKVFTSMARMGLLSPSGRSRTFDAAADGWVLSEGVGAAILKRLEDAERDGDHIYGVIRGCGINQDGAKNGLTSLKATGQTALQLRVYKEAGIDPESIDYMEVHGLSSLLGDEMELFAMRQSFAPFTKEKGFCALGTSKPNIGHPFFAAGMASLLKVLLALKHRQIPPLIAPEEVNEGIGLEASPFYLNTKLIEWKRRDGRPRRAAINGLSAFGTNCHLVIDEHVTQLTTSSDPPARPVTLFPLSARNDLSLHELASNLLKFLQGNPDVSLVDAAFTLQVGREAMEERLAFTANSLEEAKRKLSNYLSEGRCPNVYRYRTEQIDPATELLVSGEEGRQFLAAAIRNRSLDKLALLWAKGIEIDWRLLYEDSRARRISLPTYPFARTRYWHPHLRKSDHLAPSQNGSLNERPYKKNDSSSASELIIANSDSSQDSAGAGQMIDLLRTIIGEVLRCSAEEIDPDRDLSLYGFDSLYVLRVVDRFKARTNLQLTPRIFFGCRTIGELVQKISEQPFTDSVSPRTGKVLLQASSNGNHFADGTSNGERQTENGERELAIALDRLRVSEGQKALWTIQQNNPADHAYNLPIAVFWNEPIDFATLQEVLEQIAEEQPALRTSLQFEGTELGQKVQVSVPVVIHQEDLGRLSEAEVVDHLNNLNKVPFDLARAPLWRVHGFSLSNGRNILLLKFHHLIFDGYSAGFLLEEVEGRYRSIRQRLRFDRRVPRRELADYITIERRYLASEAFEQDRAYWLGQFPTGLPGRQTSKDGADRKMNDGAGAVVQMPIHQSLIRALKDFATAERVTLQAVCLAAFEMVLAMDSATEEVAAGVAVNVRPADGFDEVIGFFVNILPIRAMVSGPLPFRDFLQQIFNQLLQALEHRAFPFRRLVQAWTENYGTANVLQAAFYFQTWSSAEQCRFADRLVPDIHQSGEFNLVFEVMEAPADWRLTVKYRPAFCSRARVEGLAAKFTALLATIAKNPENSLSRILEENRSATESGTAMESGTFNYPRHRCVQELIEDQVAQRGEEVAVIFREQHLTYRELNNRANQLSHYLIGSGVRPGTLVGVMLERSLEMLVGLLAVWKAGAAYIPLDATHPAERLKYILNDAGAEWLLTNSSCQFVTGTIRAIKVDDEKTVIRRQPIAKPAVASAPDNLAYVIYTSGSTGDPKGVQITHRNLTHFFSGVAQHPGCTADDYVLACTTICFDIAALELFLPLVTGAQVEILPEEIVKNGLRLKEKIEGSPATLMQATPATWKMLLAAELGRIPRVKALCGGEAWDVQLANQLLVRTCELWNMYGPTETTIWSSIQKVEPGQPICLGDPIGNTQFYVFDETMQPVKPGEVGELFIGGDGLAKGYLNRPELTRERFIPNPLCPEELIYRTGDLVRYV